MYAPNTFLRIGFQRGEHFDVQNFSNVEQSILHNRRTDQKAKSTSFYLIDGMCIDWRRTFQKIEIKEVCI